MSDFSRDWRPSANLSFAPPNDPLRREMMLRGIFEPDDSRLARGTAPMPEEQRGVLGRLLSNEDALGPASTNWFGEQRVLPPQAFGPPAGGAPQRLLGQPDALGALGARPFMQQNDLAISDAAIGDLLQGRAAQPSGFLGTLGRVGGLREGASPLEHLGPAVPFDPSRGW